MDACQFYGGENDGLMTGHLHPAAAPPPIRLVHTWHNISLQWVKRGTIFLAQEDCPIAFVAFGNSFQAANIVWDATLDKQSMKCKLVFFWCFFFLGFSVLRFVYRRGTVHSHVWAATDTAYVNFFNLYVCLFHIYKCIDRSSII